MVKQELDLSPAEVNAALINKQEIDEASIPAVSGAKKYFALVDYKGTVLLCILDNGKWRPTSQVELLKLL